MDISPVEIDDALVIEDDDISDDEDDDHEDVCFLGLLIFVYFILFYNPLNFADPILFSSRF